MYNIFLRKFFLIVVSKYFFKLFYHLLRQRCFPEPRVKFYAAEISHAIGYMHSKDIIYRDLKPENILINCDVRYGLLQKLLL